MPKDFILLPRVLRGAFIVYTIANIVGLCFNCKNMLPYSPLAWNLMYFNPCVLGQ